VIKLLNKDLPERIEKVIVKIWVVKVDFLLHVENAGLYVDLVVNV
jgi:hypothetical protein